MNNILADHDTEFSVLVTAYLRKDALIEIAELDDSDFYYERNRHFFRALKDLLNQGKDADFVTLRDYFIRSGVLENLGGDDFFLEISKAPTTFSIRQAIGIIRSWSSRRKILAAVDKAKHDIDHYSITNDEIIHEVQERLILDDAVQDNFKTLFDLTRDGVQSLSVGNDFLKTGLEELDKKIVGIFSGELNIIAARPGMGKTTLALQIAEEQARDGEVLFVSLEMSEKQLGMKIVSRFTMIDSMKMRRGTLNDGDIDRIHRSIPEIARLKLTVLCNTYSIDGILNKVRKFARRHDLKAVYIDYLQLIRTNSKEQRYIQVGEISGQLKKLAVELHIPIVALAQLNRNAENNAPQLSDLRESGSIEQDADVVMFIHAPKGDDGGRKMDSEGGEVYFNVAKNRNGSVGRVKLYFDKKYSSFTSLAPDGGQVPPVKNNLEYMFD